MKRILIASIITLIFFNLTLAQKRTTILGDAWTGEVVATDADSREITIKYMEKGKTETFTGLLAEGYQVKMKDGSSHDLKVSEIPIGTRVRVFSRTKEQGIGGRKVKINRISRIDFLGKDEFSRLRESLNLESSVTVTIVDSGNLPTVTPLKLYLAIDLPRIKDCFVDWVSKWNKEQAIKYGPLEIVPDLAQSDVALIAYRGSESMIVPFPVEFYDPAGNVRLNGAD